MSKDIAGKGLSFLLHTRQALGAIVFIVVILWWFALPAMEQFIEKTINPKLELIYTEQKKQTVRVNQIVNRQGVIIAKQDIGEVLDAEMREDIKELLRLIRRAP